MAKTTLIDEIHLGFFVPSGLSNPDGDAIRVVLNDAKFLRQLRRAVNDVLRLHQLLGRIRLTVTR
jgi:hypothetical protein